MTRNMKKRAIWLTMSGSLIGGTLIALWLIVRPSVEGFASSAKEQERAVVLDGLHKDLDRRFFKKGHYNPTGPDDDTWYGFSPSMFPPGVRAPWVSDARWNRIAFRPKDSVLYRYGLHTSGKNAWVLAYGDVDGDGVYAQVYRRYEDGRMVREWAIRPHE
jgi:hypothetical protein